MAGGYALVPGDAGKPSFSNPRTATGQVLASIQRGVPVDRLDFLAMREEMRASGASVVLVGPMPRQNNAIGLFQAVLGAPATVMTGDVALWTGVPSLLG